MVNDATIAPYRRSKGWWWTMHFSHTSKHRQRFNIDLLHDVTLSVHCLGCSDRQGQCSEEVRSQWTYSYAELFCTKLSWAGYETSMQIEIYSDFTYWHNLAWPLPQSHVMCSVLCLYTLFVGQTCNLLYTVGILMNVIMHAQFDVVRFCCVLELKLEVSVVMFW